MSVHDLGLEVVCDGCKRESVVYTDGAGWRDSQIEHELLRDGWIVEDNQHFCSDECLRKFNRG